MRPDRRCISKKKAKKLLLIDIGLPSRWFLQGSPQLNNFKCVFRFRENTNRFPKAKLVIVTLIIELEYLLKCRQIMGAETFGVLDMIKTLRREINWTE